jgi:pimeloyl-ACP methyl ester carboxylesterase
MTAYRTIEVKGSEVFYRESGDPSATTLLLFRVMLDLLYDYQNNVASYPAWQAYLRNYTPPALLAWGRNDAFFPPEGARAYLQDLPEAELHLLDTGHFATATHSVEIAELITAFLHSHVVAPAAA